MYGDRDRGDDRGDRGRDDRGDRNYDRGERNYDRGDRNYDRGDRRDDRGGDRDFEVKKTNKVYASNLSYIVGECLVRQHKMI